MKYTVFVGVSGLTFLAGCLEAPTDTTSAALPPAGTALEVCRNETARDADVRADEVVISQSGTNATGSVFRASVYGATYACTIDSQLKVVDFRPV